MRTKQLYFPSKNKTLRRQWGIKISLVQKTDRHKFISCFIPYQFCDPEQLVSLLRPIFLFVEIIYTFWDYLIRSKEKIILKGLVPCCLANLHSRLNISMLIYFTTTNPHFLHHTHTIKHHLSHLCSFRHIIPFPGQHHK